MCSLPIRFQWGIAAILLSSLLAGPASSQTLLGLDDAMAGPPPMLHEFTPGCGVVNVCPLLPIPGPVPFPHGGVAYGKCTATVWSTDGLGILVQTDLMCNVLLVCPLPAIAAPWSGLDIDENTGTMYYTDLAGNLGQATVPAGGCPVRPFTICPLPGLAGPPTGVDYDEVSGTFWVCDAAGQVINYQASPVGGVCRILSRFRAVCPSGVVPQLLSGIAVEACRGVVHLSDQAAGIITMTMAGMPVNCCTVPSVPPPGTFLGLSYRPQPSRPMGVGCSGNLCLPCTPLAQALGDATPASTCFSLDLQFAPTSMLAPTLAFLMLNSTPGPIAVPGFCGPFWVGFVPAPFFLGPVPVLPNPVNPPPCDGMASVPVPIPPSLALCGANIFVQWLIVCPATPVPDFAMSNGLSIVFS